MKWYKLFCLISFVLLANVPYAASIERTCDAYYVIERSAAVYPSPAPPASAISVTGCCNTCRLNIQSLNHCN